MLIILFVSQSRTFPGKWRGQSVKLVVDLKRGLRLYSATDRVCVYYFYYYYYYYTIIIMVLDKLSQVVLIWVLTAKVDLLKQSVFILSLHICRLCCGNIASHFSVDHQMMGFIKWCCYFHHLQLVHLTDRCVFWSGNHR